MSERRSSAEHYFSENPKSSVKYGLIQTLLRGRRFVFVTASSVFSKKRLDTGTRLLIENMSLPGKGLILDLGCGYGAVGVTAARLNPSLNVIMTDVNARAVRLAQENITRNKVTNAEVRQGYLYEPVKGLKFNCVLSNPPVSAGLGTVIGLIGDAPQVLSPGGSLQVVVRSKISGKKLPSAFESAFGHCKILARQSGYRVLMGEKQ